MAYFYCDSIGKVPQLRILEIPPEMQESFISPGAISLCLLRKGYGDRELGRLDELLIQVHF